jgi:hypothetical protein
MIISDTRMGTCPPAEADRPGLAPDGALVPTEFPPFLEIGAFAGMDYAPLAARLRSLPH